MRFVGIAIIACIVGFGFGLLIGRHFPAHSFQKFGETRFVLDPATGKVCDPFKDPTANPTDLSDLFGNSAPAKDANGFPIVKNAPSGSPDPYAAYGGHEIKPPSNYPPACGK